MLNQDYMEFINKWEESNSKRQDNNDLSEQALKCTTHNLMNPRPPPCFLREGCKRLFNTVYTVVTCTLVHTTGKLIS